ncbi:MAG: OmpA family protein [Labilithrix sp.]
MALPREAAAQGFALNRFEPAERGSQWFVLDHLDLRGHLRPAVGLGLDYQYQPIAIKQGADKDVTTAVVGHVVTTHAGANVVLWNRLRVGASLPILFYNEGEPGRLRGQTIQAPADRQGVGDLRFGADARLFGTSAGPITMAFGGRFWVPTGSPASYTGDGFVRGGPRLSAAGKVGLLVYGANIGAMFRDPKSGVVGEVPIDHDLVYGVSAGLSLVNGRVTVGPELYGSTVLGNEAFKTRTSPLEAILGGHGEITHGLRGGIGVGKGLVAGFGSPEVRVLASLEWAMPYREPVVVAPPPIADNDGDGIADEVDACPEIPGVKTSDKRTNGCDDRDKDSIFDPLDACPDTPGVPHETPAKNGCPADKDDDGILDEVDACIDVKGIPSDDPKLHGCPDPDRDKDGIPNDQDSCPDNAGPAHKTPARNGCPVAFIRGQEILIKEQVNFQIGSYLLLENKGTLEVLNAVKEILTAHPEITKLRVEGHTDNRGQAAWNKKLSDARAISVVNWLVRKGGIDKKRLTSVGWGQERPLDSNDSDEGRAINRRVEFHIEGGAPEAAPAVELPADPPKQ